MNSLLHEISSDLKFIQIFQQTSYPLPCLETEFPSLSGLSWPTQI